MEKKMKIRNLMAGLLMAVLVATFGFDLSGEVAQASVSQAQTVANYALSQVGVRERSAGSDDVVYNDWYYGRRVYNRYSGQYSWCHAFVSYVANQCGISSSVIPKTASCQSGVSWFKARGRYYTRSSGYTPQVGDIIYMSTSAGSTVAHHVGIVYGVNSSYVYYVDGNNTTTSPHSVVRSSKARSNARILGYGNPAYTSAGTSGGTGEVTQTYQISNVKVKSITTKKVTLQWETVNLPRSCMVVTMAGKTSKTGYAVGSGSVSNSFEATFSRTDFSTRSCNIIIYAYSTKSGAGANETVHRVTYGSSTTGELVFPEVSPQTCVDSIPSELVASTWCRGWTIADASNPVVRVTCYVNGDAGHACTVFTRSDVSKAYSAPYQQSGQGWKILLNPQWFKDGVNSNSVKVVAYRKDGSSYQVTSRTTKAIKLPERFFDAAFYYANNRLTDSKIAKIGVNEAALEEHYYTYGIQRGQKPNIAFSPAYYKSGNPDLKSMDYTKLYRHYVEYCLGHHEFRSTSEFLNLYTYKNRYSDLRRPFGTNTTLYTEHFITYGSRLEGRLGANTTQAKAFQKVWSPRKYSAYNSDVKKACGSGNTLTSATNLWRHFWFYNVGYSELRKSNATFSMATYRSRYGLARDGYTILWNYLNYGYSAGRRAV